MVGSMPMVRRERLRTVTVERSRWTSDQQQHERGDLATPHQLLSTSPGHDLRSPAQSSAGVSTPAESQLSSSHSERFRGPNGLRRGLFDPKCPQRGSSPFQAG